MQHTEEENKAEKRFIEVISSVDSMGEAMAKVARIVHELNPAADDRTKDALIKRYQAMFRKFFDQHFIDPADEKIQRIARSEDLLVNMYDLLRKNISREEVENRIYHWFMKQEHRLGKRIPQRWAQAAAKRTADYLYDNLKKAREEEAKKQAKEEKREAMEGFREAKAAEEKKREEEKKDTGENSGSAQARTDDALSNEMKAELEKAYIESLQAKKDLEKIETDAKAMLEKHMQTRREEKIAQTAEETERLKKRLSNPKILLHEIYDKYKGQTRDLMIYLFRDQDQYIAYSSHEVKFDRDDPLIIDRKQIRIDPGKKEIGFTIPREKIARFATERRKIITAAALADPSGIDKVIFTNQLIWGPSTSFDISAQQDTAPADRGSAGMQAAKRSPQQMLPEPPSIKISRINGIDARKDVILPLGTDSLDIECITKIPAEMVGRTRDKRFSILLQVDNSRNRMQSYEFKYDEHPEMFKISDGNIRIVIRTPLVRRGSLIGKQTIIKAVLFETKAGGDYYTDEKKVGIATQEMTSGKEQLMLPGGRASDATPESKEGAVTKQGSSSITGRRDPKDRAAALERLKDLLNKRKRALEEGIGLTDEIFRKEYESDRNLASFLNRLYEEIDKDLKGGTRWTHDTIIKHVKKELEEFMRKNRKEIGWSRKQASAIDKRIRFFAEGSLQKLRIAIKQHGRDILQSLSRSSREVAEKFRSPAALNAELQRIAAEIEQFNSRGKDAIDANREKAKILGRINDVIDSWIKHLEIKGTPEEKIKVEKESLLAINEIRNLLSREIDLRREIKEAEQKMDQRMEAILKSQLIAHLIDILAEQGYSLDDFRSQKEWSNKLKSIFKKR